MSVIRTALIGFGTAGRVFHAPLIAAEPRFSLRAVVTGAPERAEAVRGEYHDTEVLATTDALFARADEFDLVVIGSPNDSHAPLALASIDAGLHVVIDKPVAVTSAEAHDVASAARKAGVALTVFQNRRWDGDFRTLQDTIESGHLGEVRQFESAFEWWKPEVGNRWKDLATPQEGGGILYDLGPHLIDQALRLFGDVTAVHAELDRRRAGTHSDDDTFVTLHHACGVRSRLWMSAVAPSPRPRFRVTGSSGVFQSEGLDPQEAQSIAGLSPLDVGFGRRGDDRAALIMRPDSTTAVPLQAGNYLEFYRQLGAALGGNGTLPVDPSDSIRVLEIIEQARQDIA